MQSYDFYAELKNTNEILMKLPYFRQLSDDNELLHERIQSLKATIEYLESKNRRLYSKVVKYKTFYKKSKKVSKKKQSFGNVIDLVSDDDSDDNVPVVVDIKQEKVVQEGDQEAKGNQEQGVQEVKEEEDVDQEEDQKEVIEYEIVEVVVEADQNQEAGEEAEGEVVEGDEEEVVEGDEEEVVEGDEEEVVEGDEEEEEEVVEGDEEEVVEGEEEKVVEGDEEEVVEGEEEEVVEGEEEEVVEAEGEEGEGEEGEEAEGEEEEEAEVYDIEINGKTYYVQNEKDSPIYEADENGDISMEVGVYKKGVPTFF